MALLRLYSKRSSLGSLCSRVSHFFLASFPVFVIYLIPFELTLYMVGDKGMRICFLSCICKCIFPRTAHKSLCFFQCVVCVILSQIPWWSTCRFISVLLGCTAISDSSCSPCCFVAVCGVHGSQGHLQLFLRIGLAFPTVL